MTSTQFRKGQSGNPNGRPKGSKNRAPLIAKNAIAEALEAEAPHLQKLLRELDPKDRIEAFVKLAKYVLPTLKATEVQAEIDGKLFQKIKLPEWLENG